MRIELIGRVSEIFDKKNWEMDQEITTSKFNLFCGMLSRLENDEEISLMLELLEDFLHINNEFYSKRIINGFKNLLTSNSQINTFFVLPLLAEEDLDKYKSSHLVHYLFKGSTFKYKMPQLKNVNIKVINKIEQVSSIKNNQQIILVDDFIGTGETTISAVNYLLKTNLLLKKQDISVLTIVIQKSGLEVLAREGINVFYSISVGKGISDKHSGDEMEKRINIMSKIEDRLKGLKPDFRFGYKQSEALVSMERTPNNTFPIFWYEGKNINIAPFPR